ncbi:unnamed protein product [Tilletia laevis]|nr:unnamed protein product [Tilletia caries]CAD6914941.1 unnamed protein product [Tilletia laevis]
MRCFTTTIAVSALLSSISAAAVGTNIPATALIGRQVGTTTTTSLLIEPSPVGQGACTLHIDHWQCEGTDPNADEGEQAHDDEPEPAAASPTTATSIIAAFTTTTTTATATALAAVAEPSPTDRGACHLHGDHWHCDLDSEEESGESHEGHSHEGHSHAGHSHGPSEEYGCGLAPLENYDLGLQIGAVFILLIVSLLGVMLPGVSGWASQRIERRGGDGSAARSAFAYAVFALQHFGGGIILSTAFVHLLAHASVYFSNSCLGELQYEATIFGLRPLRQRVLSTMGVVPAGCCGTVQPEHHTDDKHSTSESAESDADAASLENAAIQAQGRLAKYEVMALEAGIIFHSIIIGVSIGTSSGPGWKAFLIAIAFHQFCEGLALASRISILPTTWMLTKLLMYAVFVLTTPVGVAIGIGVRQSYNGNNRSTLLAIGSLNSISAGILIYSAMVQIIAGDFIYNKEMLLAPIRRPLIAFVFFTLGAIVMSVLGKWA